MESKSASIDIYREILNALTHGILVISSDLKEEFLRNDIFSTHFPDHQTLTSLLDDIVIQKQNIPLKEYLPTVLKTPKPKQNVSFQAFLENQGVKTDFVITLSILPHSKHLLLEFNMNLESISPISSNQNSVIESSAISNPVEEQKSLPQA
jgi:hypothetical protein